jgi:DNA invertase Pin-like site-specific DNA recombinase
MNTNALLTSSVTAAQRAKLAYVYIRQSSLGQVTRNSESTDLQYALVERAVRLGWPRERVQVIDEDLGKSGASAEDRRGFQSLIAEVSLGHVGLIISLDASRMARNNSDWYQLLDLCSIFGVLIADSERLYDPRTYHDRLLLGLSGMMSEAELHQLKLRLQAGARHKAERGELRTPLPVGLVRARDGAVTLNPDEEVQARLRLIFSKFAELGSARAVSKYLTKENLLVPSRPQRGPCPNDVVWEPPRSSTILYILHNPAYAGAYVYGRHIVDRARRKPGQQRGGVIQVPLADWAVCIKDAYPAYIPWETYLANQARLQANRNLYDKGGRGVPREGKALLQGIVLCGRCGRHLSIRYSGPQGTYPVYRCAASTKEFGAPLCQEVRALGLDAEVERLLLAALEPDRITLALEALDQLELELKSLERQWQLRLERRRYEAQRAQRQYNTVEPENRLVARQLEREWEEKLRALELVEQEYEAWKLANRNEITPEDRREILLLGEDLPKVWSAATTSNADRKYLLQLVIKEIIVDQKRAPGKLWFQVNWQTGAATQHLITRTCISYSAHGEVEQIKRRVSELNSGGSTDQKIAQRLNAEGLRTTYGDPFNYKNVHDLRRRWGIPNVKEAGLNPDRLRWADGSYTIRGVVEAVGVTKGTVHSWLKQGLLKGTQLGTYMLWKIELTDELIESLRKRTRSGCQKRVSLSSPAGPSKCRTLIAEKGRREGGF